jgi:fatty acid/phospholipid biosynthesis enzyme
MDGMKKAYTKAHQQRKEKRAQTKVRIDQELADQDNPKRIRHDMELLDEVIQKGFDTLNKMEVISPVTAIKAIEMKHKLTSGSAGGYTVYGIEEIKLREAAREQAVVTAILEFIPKEQHVTVMKRMEQAEREYYESIGLGEAYAQMKSA